MRRKTGVVQTTSLVPGYRPYNSLTIAEIVGQIWRFKKKHDYQPYHRLPLVAKIFTINSNSNMVWLAIECLSSFWLFWYSREVF